MTNKEAVIWLTHISADIGKAEHRDLWHYEQALSEIKEMLETSQPEPQWIPCSPETMPKKTDYYLVQYTRKYCRNEMAVAFYSVEEARCDDDYTWEIETFSDIKEVIAWMPLPEPYDGDKK